MINCQLGGTHSGWNSVEEAVLWPGIWQADQPVSDTFVSSMRHRRGVGLRLHTFGFVPSIPGTLNINHKVVKSV